MLEYRIGGRKVTAAQFHKHMRDSVIQAGAEAARKHIEQVRCPAHGQFAKARRKATVGDRIEFEVTGCCDQLVARAQEALR